MKTVEVFKTTVTDPTTAAGIINTLQEMIPGSTVNFDLDDCDNILRVISKEVVTDVVSRVVSQCGYHCEVLQD